MARWLHASRGMSDVLPYYTPESDWSRHTELSWEQAALNAGARRIYAARQRRPQPSHWRPHLGHSTLPASFAPPVLATLPSKAHGWTH